MYIWELNDWQGEDGPSFQWQSASLQPRLVELAGHREHLIAQHDSLSAAGEGWASSAELNAAHVDALTASALRSSEIEGEHLDVASLRSSVITQLGLDKAGFPNLKSKGNQQTDSLVKLLLEATTQINTPLSTAVLCQWQASLFTHPSPMGTLRIGKLRGDDLMQVVSGRIDRPTVHFEAPPGNSLEAELRRFTHWFNQPPADMDPFIRAGIVHLWFITLHPFDDGNGRVARALTDRALAQAEGIGVRYYSHSAAIMQRRNQYYDILEKTQRGSLDITPWLDWFLDVLGDAMLQGQQRFERVVRKARFWRRHAQTVLNERQIKILNRMLNGWGEEFTEGINASKYGSLGRVSKATSTRELADLVRKDCLHKLPGGGRSTRYALCAATHSEESAG